MLRLLIVPLSEIKNCVVVTSIQIKVIKRKTLLSCGLKHIIKKRNGFDFGKLNLLKLSRWIPSSLLL